MTAAKQEFQAAIEGDVAGRDIVNEAPRTNIHIAAINGGQNIIGQTGDIHLQMPARPRIKVVIQPGPEHIDQKKAANLKSLVTEVVRLEKLVKRSPKGYATVWNALTTRCKTTSYLLILDEDYPKAEKFLREWIGRLSSAKSAPAKDANWRKRKFSYIFTNVRQLNAEQALRARLLERFGSESMKDLSDTDLDAVYQLVAGWKKVGHAPGQAGA